MPLVKIPREKVTDMPYVVQFIQQNTSTNNWDNVTDGQVFAHIRPADSREIYAANQIQSNVDHVITIYYPHLFTPLKKMRIKATINRGEPTASSRTRVFKIKAIVESLEADFMTFNCEELPRQRSEV